MSEHHQVQTNQAFDKSTLTLDVAQETTQIVNLLRQSIHHRLRRQGAVVGISGGIDSSVVLGLCAQALGPERVVGILLPEKDSSAESVTLAQEVATHYRVPTVVEDITAALQGLGCYRRRDEAIARVFPEYTPEWKDKITDRKSVV